MIYVICEMCKTFIVVDLIENKVTIVSSYSGVAETAFNFGGWLFLTSVLLSVAGGVHNSDHASNQAHDFDQALEGCWLFCYCD